MDAEPVPVAEAVDPSEALEALFRREYRAMVRVAFLMLRDPEVAEEMVQDAFAVLHEKWGRVDNPGGYLRRVVINRCNDRLRRRTIETASIARLRSEAADLGADLLFDALAVLPHRQRAAIVLRFYLDCTEAEIANALRVRRGTVKSLVHRGLSQLRKDLA